MEWYDDPAEHAATLIAEPYRCRVWYTTLGNWAAVISHHGIATAAYNFPTLEEAKAWCEAQVTDSGQQTA